MLRDEEQHLKLLPGQVYILPNGYKIRMEKHPAAPSYRLVGTVAEGTFCHKPCTVSGGGKSEISKSLIDAVLYGPVYVSSFEDDLSLVEAIFERDFRDAQKPHLRQAADQAPPSGDPGARRAAPILSPDRSLGSVIKLLTPNPDYTPEYNAVAREHPELRASARVRDQALLPHRLGRGLATALQRRHHQRGARSRAQVRREEARRQLPARGVLGDGAWRTYKLRQDFVSADKVQMEDDISASVVVPAGRLFGLPKSTTVTRASRSARTVSSGYSSGPTRGSPRVRQNRPSGTWRACGLFCSNFQPLSSEDAQDLVENVALHDAFTEPMRSHVSRNAGVGDAYSICSARPRLVGGKPTKNRATSRPARIS